MKDRIKVMLTTEGTYPFYPGGVSAWCDALCEGTPEVDYTIYSVVQNPYVTPIFELPSSANLLKVPLWGTEEPSEHIINIPFSQKYIAKKHTRPADIKEHFIPLFSQLVREVYAQEKNPLDLGRILHELYSYFLKYDYYESFKSEITWNTYKTITLENTQNQEGHLAKPSVFDITQSLGWLYHYMVVLNTPLPDIDIAHSTAAAFCGIPCVLAKLDKKIPFLLTEHGVYLREQYLFSSALGATSFVKKFYIQLVRSLTYLNYQYADQVLPVCAYNTRWEREMGTGPEKIKVIYNGVDPNVFTPGPVKTDATPVVAITARIDPVKDLGTMLKAADIVKGKIPEVRFLVYGSVTVASYYQECLETHRRLQLKDSFVFAGHTDDLIEVYHTADVVALSSISEGFPYSVLEAMMCARPVVSTDVGGIREALGNCGIVVEPRQPQELAAAIIKLLEDTELRLALGKQASQRALNYFTIDRMIGEYLVQYRTWTGHHQAAANVVEMKARQSFHTQKAYELSYCCAWKEALAEFGKAVELDINSPAVPALLLEMAKIYIQLGRRDLAANEIEKARAMSSLITGDKLPELKRRVG